MFLCLKTMEGLRLTGWEILSVLEFKSQAVSSPFHRPNVTSEVTRVALSTVIRGPLQRVCI